MHNAVWLAAVTSLCSGCALDYAAFDVTGQGAGAVGGSGAAGDAGTGASADGAGGGGGGNDGGLGTGGVGAGGAGVGANGGGGSGGQPNCGVLTYSASIVDCLDPADPDPDVCAAQMNNDGIIIDAYYGGGGGGKRVAYLRFDLDDGFVPAAVTSVRLLLTTDRVEGGGQNPSGVVWTVTSFSRTELFSTLTLPDDLTLVSGDVGPIGDGATATWSLPVNALAPNTALTLRLEPPPGTGDGLIYWSNAGSVPPALVVSCE